MLFCLDYPKKRRPNDVHHLGLGNAHNPHVLCVRSGCSASSASRLAATITPTGISSKVHSLDVDVPSHSVNKETSRIQNHFVICLCP